MKKDALFQCLSMAMTCCAGCAIQLRFFNRRATSRNGRASGTLARLTRKKTHLGVGGSNPSERAMT
jgi:hypothetical protein